MTNDQAPNSNQSPKSNDQMVKSDADPREAVMETVVAWLVEVFRELSPKSRQEVLKLAEELAERERWQRLIGNECNE